MKRATQEKEAEIKKKKELELAEARQFALQQKQRIEAETYWKREQANEDRRQENLKKQSEADELMAKMLSEENEKQQQKWREKDEKDNACSICYEPLFALGEDC